ncbi:hypothetical protein ACVWYH_009917 [Bradyrhizobium sp. GM24.11]
MPYSAMHSAAAIIRRSPRQAPDGAELRSERSATATPSVATTTPIDLRQLRASLPSAAPITSVNSGSVDSASAPRAAVVKISDALNRIGNSAKNRMPSPIAATQSPRPGQRSPRSNVSGSSRRKPIPNRNEPIASGSMLPTR